MPSIKIHQQSEAPDPGHHIDYLPATFLAAVVWFLPSGTDSAAINSLSITFVSIVLEAVPFMFVGSLIGGIIEAFVSREWMIGVLPRRGWLTVCIAAGAGMLLPVCECGVVPVVRRLMGKGLPQSAAIAYLLGGPIVNPIVAISTALAYTFNWNIVALRLGLGYTTAVTIGLIIGRLFKDRIAINAQNSQDNRNPFSCGCISHIMTPDRTGKTGKETVGLEIIASETRTETLACGCSHRVQGTGWENRMGSAFLHAVDDFLSVGHYLVIGAFLAALAQTFIDRSVFMSITGIPFLSIVIMMVLAILLNLCSEADAFLAASFRGLMPLSAQMAFMLTGPMFDLKLLMMYKTVFKPRAIVALSALILVIVLGVSTGLEWIIGAAS
ncbi:MAG: permease [Pseudomonadota bacterium]